MTKITESIEIARNPEEVFAYLDQLERHGEWQDQIVSSTRQTEGPNRVGTRMKDVRWMGNRTQEVSWEITEYDPPRRVAFRGVDGPLRPVGSLTVEPSGSGSRVTVELELEPHGLMGKMLAGMATGQARKQVPKDQAKLKERLESGV